MSKQAFEEGVAATAEVEQQKPATTTAVATTPRTSAVGHPMGGADDFVGEVESSDIKIPKLNIAQKIGPLSDDFPFGHWVLNRAVVLAEMGEELRFTPLRATKTYVEALDYGSDVMPRRFGTKAEVEAAGLRTEFDGETGDKPEVNQNLDVVCLIRQTDTDSPEFSLEFEGEKYALALWTIGSWNAYNSAAKPLLTARTQYLRSFHQREWIAKTEKHVMGNGNAIAIPKLVGGPENTEEFKAWADSLVG